MILLDPMVLEMKGQIDLEIHRLVAHPLFEEYPGLGEMLRFHFGWDGEGNGPEALGKRIRPLIVLLSCTAVGGNWNHALPAATGVELLHNFSLIHDDIEDGSPLRHGRATLWNKWGQALAINAGDALFALAYAAIFDLYQTIPPRAAQEAVRIFNETCIRLTGGQHLDIAFERERSISEGKYWQMIGGKTAALLSACARLGALIGGAPESQIEFFGNFGTKLGLSFQVQDDWLGLWGNLAETGKSSESDLVTGKKTLPVVFALAKNSSFAKRWRQGPILSHEVSELSHLLIEEGAQAYTEGQSTRLTREALEALEMATGGSRSGAALNGLAETLLKRSR